MPSSPDRQRFRNEDLTLKVGTAVDRTRWDESRYEAFIDELCGDREYQKDAIRTALRYLLGGEYKNLRDLAKANYEQNSVLEHRYGSWDGMQRHLQLPNQLSASLDLATGTGKSYVLYGIAAILLAEGVVDRVLVLVPSTTIEYGLMDKFERLAGDAGLRDLLPADTKLSSPRIINANSFITEGSICVENYHAVLEHVGSSIRDSLLGRGARTVILNDEAHHVSNGPATQVKKWKEFLVDPNYGFYYVLGVSGTCYVEDEYFADVIYRYSLRQAMEERYVKRVDYIAEMPQTGGDPTEEKWQLIHNRHEEFKRKLRQRNITPLTLIITQKITRCKDVAEELKAFLIEKEMIDPETADERVLTVYNNAPDVNKLPLLDSANNNVEWIVSVSMLNEGWDVKRVFQIVPHEERAFNSKLLIAQVLGRGLRVPDSWNGPQPEVVVFNHDAWAPRIRHLVNDILEIEKRLSVRVIEDSPYHFVLHNIDYTLEPTSVKKPMEGEYKFFSKGYIELAADVDAEDVNVEFERALTGDRYSWQTRVQHRTYSPREIAAEMYRRLEEAEEDLADSEGAFSASYTKQFPVERLEQIVKESLSRRKMSAATDKVKQKFLQSLGTLRRRTSENVRYTPIENRFVEVPTLQRQSGSVSAADLRRDKYFFYTEQTRNYLKDEQIEFFDEIAEEDSGFKRMRVLNQYDFKTPLSGVIADSDPERRFIKMLLEPANMPHFSAWIKSTASRFYEIAYSWKKGEHPKRGMFSPDFFIKADNLILVLEVKGNEELTEPSEENRKKNEYALAHFQRVNKHLEEAGSSLRYKFNFLTPSNFITYFQYLREGRIESYQSELDILLAENG
ncbi:MAG TPA: DEAD/DEAH box helicase family protein [Pyrinomonadaceae bacterium]|jgi:type III restriction enzyme